MIRNNKKALYESIMTSVAREVKKVLNEEETAENKIDNKYAFLLQNLYKKYKSHRRINDENDVQGRIKKAFTDPANSYNVYTVLCSDLIFYRVFISQLCDLLYKDEDVKNMFKKYSEQDYRNEIESRIENEIKTIKKKNLLNFLNY